MDPDWPLTAMAYAKINLTFEILGKRPDGYHEIATVMQTINLCDTMIFEPNDDIRLASDVAGLATPANLVYRAACLLQEMTPRRGAAISLAKGIPLASGLGGGSSDAALTLRTLNRMWSLKLSMAKLRQLAARLGSDVPFFVCGWGMALATGRGEKVSILPASQRNWVVLLRPPIELPDKTKEMYARIRPASFSHGDHARRMVRDIRKGSAITNDSCFNAFDSVARTAFSGLDEYRRAFLEAGAEKVHLAGAGPMLFTLIPDGLRAEQVYMRLRGLGLQSYLAETL